MNNHALPKSKLFFREGNSDKVYEAGVIENEGGYLVNFAFGRRGSKLQTGTKTTSPVSLKEATTIFEKLIKEKTAKGYTPDEEGTPFINSKDETKVSGYLPQLLNSITEEELEKYLSNDQWLTQQKYDGQRVLIEVKEGKARAINRRGLFVDGTQEVLRQAETLSKGHHIVLDGELVKNQYFVFDLLIHDQDIRRELYFQRYAMLTALFKDCSNNGSVCHLVKSAFTVKEKQDMLSSLRQSNAEGIVFKRNTPYVSGRPNSLGDQLKFKFIDTVSVFVTGINSQRSVSIAVLKGDQPISVGNVSIPPNLPVPGLDEVLEVKYLYAMNETNALFQPVCLGVRTDINKEECTIDQLKYKEAIPN